jgi:hypothetical protein
MASVAISTQPRPATWYKVESILEAQCTDNAGLVVYISWDFLDKYDGI